MEFGNGAGEGEAVLLAGLPGQEHVKSKSVLGVANRTQKMEEDAQKSDELTAFAPFEAIKDSKLSFKGSSNQPGQIEISDSEAFGFPKVLFRRSRTPTPAGASEIQRSSNPVSIKVVRQAEKGESRVRVKLESNGTIASSRPPPPRAVSLQQPRAQVTKSLVLNRIGNLERNQVGP